MKATIVIEAEADEWDAAADQTRFDVPLQAVELRQVDGLLVEARKPLLCEPIGLVCRPEGAPPGPMIRVHVARKEEVP